LARSITSVAAASIALASIQGLYLMFEEKDARITALEEQLARLETAFRENE